jgi:hypothetical protein
MARLLRSMNGLGSILHLFRGKSASVTPVGATMPILHVEIEQFVAFLGFLYLRGRLVDAVKPIAKVAFRVAGTVMAETIPDVEHRFEIRGVLGDADFVMTGPSLLVTHADGTTAIIEHPTQFGTFDEPGFALYGRFLNRLAAMPAGNFLEIGSRARSGVIRRNDVPSSWNYTGFDVLQGDNVDVQGNAHELSTVLPHGHFNAMMSVAGGRFGRACLCRGKALEPGRRSRHLHGHDSIVGDH